jgi:hypothetical protein
MTPLAIGFSSGTLPQSSAVEFAETVVDLGGRGVDLRIGKGQRWEQEGVAAGLRDIAAAGLEVFFTGVGWRLGDPDLVVEAAAGVPVTWPVKVFCVPKPDIALITDQLAAAADAGLRLWVETHAGGPSVAGLIAIAEATGVGIVLDTLGLAEIGGMADGQLADVAPHVRAAQVKGVRRTADGTRHRPLRNEDLDIVEQIAQFGALSAITVESRAGTPRADMAVLAGFVSEQTRACLPRG